MDVEKRNLFFVSEKISKVRWILSGETDPDTFVTGSWGSSTNNVKFWKITNVEYSEEEVETVPECIEKIPLEGDITGLESLNNNTYVVSTSLGYVSLINAKKSNSAPFKKQLLHKFNKSNASCTCVSVFNKQVATAGEDGRLNLLSPNSLDVARTIENADSSSITALSFMNLKKVLTGSHNGAVKIFDMCSDSKKPAATFLSSYDSEKVANGITSICCYPTQEHIVLVGDEEGSITVWDLRNVQFPESCISAHPHAISELQFHRMDPTKLFTASENGELFQWSQNYVHPSIQLSQTNSRYGLSDTETNPWLSEEGVKSRISVTCVLSDSGKAINSFDVHGSKIICGGDAESISILENVC